MSDPEPPSPAKRTGTRARRYGTCALLGVLLLILADQLLQGTVLSDDRFMGRRVAPYDPPVFSVEQERALAQLARLVDDGGVAPARELYDAELGWCTPRGVRVGRLGHDPLGARLHPDRDPEAIRDETRVVTVGCSFTQCTESDDDETWQVALEALRPDLSCWNLGVMGYGIDQAVLRFERDGAQCDPDEVWLGFFPSSALRVTNQYRPALRHWSRTTLFKPRFVLDAADELSIVPNPGDSLDRTYALLFDQEEFVAATSADDWVSRIPAAWAPRGSSWMHQSGLARLVLTFLENRGREPLEAIADPNHDAYRLCRALGLRLRDEVEATGARFRLLILPGPADLLDLRERGRASWADWVEELEAEGVLVHDLTPALEERDRAEPGRMWAPGGHYSALGNQWVAEALADSIGELEAGD